MKTPDTIALSRQDLEEFWHTRLRAAQERYQVATAEYRRTLEEQPAGLSPGPDGPLALSRQQQSEALANYSRVLSEFSDVMNSLAEVNVLQRKGAGD